MQGSASAPGSFQHADDTHTLGDTDDGATDDGSEVRATRRHMAAPARHKAYVALWAGSAIHEPAVHPPFNLLLRLLIALCPDVVIPVSSAAAALFSMAAKPYGSGAGMSQDYSVQRRASDSTALEVRLHACCRSVGSTQTEVDADVYAQGAHSLSNVLSPLSWTGWRLPGSCSHVATVEALKS